MVDFTAGEVFAMLAIIEATNVGSIVWASNNLVTKKDLKRRLENKFRTHKKIHHNTRGPKDD